MNSSYHCVVHTVVVSSHRREFTDFCWLKSLLCARDDTHPPSPAARHTMRPQRKLQGIINKGWDLNTALPSHSCNLPCRWRKSSGWLQSSTFRTGVINFAVGAVSGTTDLFLTRKPRMNHSSWALFLSRWDSGGRNPTTFRVSKAVYLSVYPSSYLFTYRMLEIGLGFYTQLSLSLALSPSHCLPPKE